MTPIKLKSLLRKLIMASSTKNEKKKKKGPVG